MTPETPANALAQPLTRRGHVCPECGEPVILRGKGRERVFCSDAHKQAHKNRRVVRGAPIMSLLQAWRVDRGKGPVAQEAFREVCAMLDTYNGEDHEAGRPRATVHARTLIEAGSFVDRRAMTLACAQRHQGCHGKHRAPFAARGMNDARRAAAKDGWDTTPGREACPNCRDDNGLVVKAAAPAVAEAAA